MTTKQKHTPEPRLHTTHTKIGHKRHYTVQESSGRVIWQGVAHNSADARIKAREATS